MVMEPRPDQIALALDLNQEPMPPGEGMLLKVGEVAPDFEFLLTSVRKMRLSELLSRSHVLLNFIKGTWCPFCQKHLETLRNWQKNLDRRKSTTILVLSNEPLAAIQSWSRENGIPCLMGSVVEPQTVFQSYGVSVPSESFSRPGVFLVEQSGKIRMSYAGPRGTALLEQCTECGVVP